MFLNFFFYKKTIKNVFYIYQRNTSAVTGSGSGALEK